MSDSTAYLIAGLVTLWLDAPLWVFAPLWVGFAIAAAADVHKGWTSE